MTSRSLTLDNALQLMIKQWLDRHSFSPNWVRYEAISEHPSGAVGFGSLSDVREQAVAQASSLFFAPKDRLEACATADELQHWLDRPTA